MFRKLPVEVYPLAGAVTVGVAYAAGYSAHLLRKHNDIQVNKSQPIGWSQGKSSPHFVTYFSKASETK